MLLLASTSDLLQLITGSAGKIDVHASWVDNLSGTITPGRTNSVATTATTTNIVAAPAASTVRNVKTINIKNSHSANANAITVQHTDGSTIVELFQCTLAADEVLSYVEGYGWDIYAADGSLKSQSARMLYKNLASNDTGANATGGQPWFPTAGAVTVTAQTNYFFEGQLYMTRAAGTTSHTTAVLFGGTATLTSIDYLGIGRTGDTNTLLGTSSIRALAATALVVKAASTSATEDTAIRVYGNVRINAAGTFIPQFQYSAAPGGAPTILRGTFFRMWPIGSNTDTSVGVWA